jgi:hypothetical protein
MNRDRPQLGGPVVDGEGDVRALNDEVGVKVKAGFCAFQLKSIFSDGGEVNSDGGEDVSDNVDEEASIAGDCDSGVGWLARDNDV